MSKLIQKYIDNPTQTNLDKIKAHLKKHPFSIIMITNAQQNFLANLLFLNYFDQISTSR